MERPVRLAVLRLRRAAAAAAAAAGATQRKHVSTAPPQREHSAAMRRPKRTQLLARNAPRHLGLLVARVVAHGGREAPPKAQPYAEGAEKKGQRRGFRLPTAGSTPRCDCAALGVCR